MTVYYTSDWHLNHANLIKRKVRHFDSIEDQNELILKSINDTVGTNDTLFILGDLTMPNSVNTQYLYEFIRKINCKNLFVVKGNHDKTDVLNYCKIKGLIYNWDYTKVYTDNAFSMPITVMLSHYPLRDYHSAQEPTICIHGHSHGMLLPRPVDCFDVGVDVWNFKPVTLEQILSTYYGDHANPYTNYIEALRIYKIRCMSFAEDYGYSKELSRENLVPSVLN